MSDSSRNFLDFPALYKAAGLLSEQSQKHYLWTIAAEYALLIVCSAMSMSSSDKSEYYYLFTFLFVLALTLFVWRYHVKPEQAWYQGRALAESVKTSSWRFCMRAAPFDDLEDYRAVIDFGNHLKSILEANQFAGTRLSADFAAENQVTPSMLAYRQMPLADRMLIYERDRIQDQRNWYAVKGGKNKKAARRWVAFCILIYAIAIVSSLVRAAHPEYTWAPTDVLISIAACALGWIQIKKFNELSASYILTAHEIGILHGAFIGINGEADFANFINEAEQAFSREHTQWVARTS